ncbi:hypothetical protein UlMin_030772 [Ulmus minor]
MELNFGTLLFISFSSTVLLLFPATQCNTIPVSYISEVPAASPAPGPSFDPKFPSVSTFFIPQSLSRAAPRSNPHSGKAALSKLCAYTENPKLCVSSILPRMNGVTVDPVFALEIEIKTFLVLIDKAIAELNKVDKDPSTSAKSRKCLDVCLEIYNSARDDLTDAHEAIAAHDMELLQSELSGSITDLGTCEDTFEEMGIELPLDKDLVKTLHELADNCMDISELLK